MATGRGNLIEDALRAKGALDHPCPRCGGREVVFGAEGIIPVFKDPDALHNGVPNASLPVIIVGCKQCGYLSFHDTSKAGLPANG